MIAQRTHLGGGGGGAGEGGGGGGEGGGEGGGGDERILKLLRGPALGDLPHAPDGPHAGVPHALRLRPHLKTRPSVPSRMAGRSGSVAAGKTCVEAGRPSGAVS